MKYLRKLCGSLLLLSLLFMMTGQTALAAEEEYTYTVRLYAGNQGTLTGDGISVPTGAQISTGPDEIVIRGLKYGETVYITPQAAASAADEKYYVRGVRRSGRDNSEATESAFRIASDRDYVIAYGIKGDMVAYTVNYLDAQGNRLLASDTYYGVAGERQYVSARYMDGYQPQALNLVKTLSVNEAENVFDFQYTRIGTGGGTAGGTTVEEGTVTVIETPGPVTDGGVTDAGTTGGAAAGAAGAVGGGAGGAAAGDAGAADAGAGGAAGDAGAADAVGGDLVDVPDGEVPQSNLQDLDDEEVPLANIGGDQAGMVMGYLPIYIGIAAVALSALLMTAIYLKRRRKAAAERASRQDSDDRKQS